MAAAKTRTTTPGLVNRTFSKRMIARPPSKGAGNSRSQRAQNRVAKAMRGSKG